MLDYERKRQTLTVRLADELDHSAATQLRGELDELRRTVDSIPEEIIRACSAVEKQRHSRLKQEL